ncbi:MAG: hypothetical protein ISN28_05735 [Ectothiorhodospiraceae bacterium AqS1]|nr:hypothetical protein [Ectothiorhodospiraceae bacterium AqS1]
MKRLKTTFTLFALLAVFALAPRAGSACSCMVMTLEQQVDHAHRVFIGRLLEARVVFPDVEKRADSEAPSLLGEWERIEGIFEPLHRIRGEVEDREIVRTGLGGGDCGVRMEVGSVYMIFLDEDDPRIGICDGSRQIDRFDLEETVLELKSLVD